MVQNTRFPRHFWGGSQALSTFIDVCIRGWESGPQIVSVSDGGKAQVFVKMLAMSPSSPHIITPFTIKEQPKQDTGEGQLKGVEKKVNIH